MKKINKKFPREHLKMFSSLCTLLLKRLQNWCCTCRLRLVPHSASWVFVKDNLF